MAKKAYLAKTQIDHDGKPYAVGETIELDDKIDAPALLAVGAIAPGGTAPEGHKPAPAAKKPAEK